MYSSFTSSYMQPSERVRRQWLAFEQWIETVPRAAMEKQILETFQDMDAKWKATPARTRPTKQDHDKAKAAFRRELEDGLVTLAREDWQRRLEEAGLKDEDWGEMTFKETLAVEKLLGGDLDEEGMAIMESVAREDDEPVGLHATGAPVLTNETRASNLSGYSFVSPMSLSVVDDDEGDTYESIFKNEILPSSGPESVVDEIFDAPTSVLWGRNGDLASYGIWSASTSQSSRQSSQTGSPERPPLKTISADTFFPPPDRATLALPFRVDTNTNSDEVSDEEADFERFKMETRIAKIREFHDEAARADIQLAQDIYHARKTMGKGEEARRIVEHEKRMIELRRSKEQERKTIVRAERETRREAFKLRQLRSIPMDWSAGETARDRLAQEVESKLTLGTGFFPTEPVVPSAEIRRGRRLSQSTISSSKSQQTRDAEPVITPELDRLAANVPFGGVICCSSIHFIHPSFLGILLDVLLPESNCSMGSAPRKQTHCVNNQKEEFTFNCGSSFGERGVSWPLSFGVEPQLPFLPSAPAASTLFSAPPPTTSQPIVSSVSASSLKAKAPTSKGPSPAATKASKNQPPPVPATSKGPSPVPSKSQPPSVQATSKAPAPAKAPSPAASKSQPPAPPTSKGPSPASSKGQSSPIPAKRQPPPPNPQPPPTSSKATAPPAPSAETPKPTAPTIIPQKKARGAETETPGASSSRTTLEQMPRPFMHKSLGSGASIGAPPPPAAPGREIWVSSSSAAAAAKKAGSVKSVSSTSSASQMDKSTSAPAPRLPVLAETNRTRRVSDPISSGPRSLAFPDNAQEVKQAGDALPSATKKSKGKQAKSKRVTVEEVSDEEDADNLDQLPVDYKHILEPKPSVPSAVFSHIIDFEPTPSPAPPFTIQSDASSRATSALPNEINESLTDDGKEKHARWTPSAGNGAPTSRSSVVEKGTSLESSMPPSAGQKKGSRNRASSLLQSGTTADQKGKSKERTMELEVDDELAKYLEGATLSLKRS
ncbi:hypothetical protein MSAN_01724100 [Mycena sanguinolenta]|uniref:Uncharacterized protein n=1 Tax=Mycena sanguinolenta TaxID=230812 RepID=A0A8H7CT71_9AGAR|nr:hypothetical protein MSAN_01724100 [Mycena sanguinolenta]